MQYILCYGVLQYNLYSQITEGEYSEVKVLKDAKTLEMEV